MNEDEIEELEDLEEIEDIADIGDDKMFERIGNKLVDKAFDKLLGIQSKEEQREQKRLQREAIRQQSEAEAHAAKLETERMRQAKLQKEIAALDAKRDMSMSNASIPAQDAPGREFVPDVLYGELPLTPRAPDMMCADNPKEFTDFLEYISTHPTSVVILGGKGYGKSALGHAILEYLHLKTGRVVVLYAPLTLPKRILPGWLRIVDSWDNIPDNAIVLVDEAALMLPSRNPGSKANRTFTELNAISRQKNLTLIFVSQSSRSLDVNALTAGDIEIIYKKPPTFAGINERKEVRDMSKVAKKLLDGVDQAHLKEYSVIFASSGDVMLMKSGLASYWNEDVSTMYKDCVGSASQQEQVKTDSKKDEILRLSSQGMTQLEISQKLGVDQGYVSRVIRGIK